MDVKKYDISYPCNWEYLVITSDRDLVVNYVNNYLKDREYKITNSKTSKFSKYYSLKISVYVYDKSDRDNIFVNLSRVNGVKVII